MKDNEIKRFFRKMSGTYTGAEAMEAEARAQRFLAEKFPEYECRVDWKRAPAEGGRRFVFRLKGILVCPKKTDRAGGGAKK